MSDNIIRATALPGENIGVIPQSIQVVAKPVATQFTVDQQADKVLVKTSQVTAEVAVASGQ